MGVNATWAVVEGSMPLKGRTDGHLLVDNEMRAIMEAKVRPLKWLLNALRANPQECQLLNL